MNKKTKIIIAVFAFLIIFGIIMAITSANQETEISCGALKMKIGTGYSKETNNLKYINGMSIPDAVYTSYNDSIYIDNATKDGCASLDEYINLVRDANLSEFDTISDIRSENGIRYIELTSKYMDDDRNKTDTDSQSMIAFYESKNNYWTVQFNTSKAQYSGEKKRFLKWAESVTFSE